jgi:hypothetical protein
MKLLPFADPGHPDTRSATRFLLWVGEQQLGTLALGMLFGTIWMLAQALLPYALGRAVTTSGPGRQPRAPGLGGCGWRWDGQALAGCRATGRCQQLAQASFAWFRSWRIAARVRLCGQA